MGRRQSISRSLFSDWSRSYRNIKFEAYGLRRTDTCLDAVHDRLQSAEEDISALTLALQSISETTS